MSMLYQGLLGSMVPQQQPQGWADRIFGGGLLGNGFEGGQDNARNQALINAGLATMAASAGGGQQRPSLGQALFSGLQAGQQAYRGVLGDQIGMRREQRQERRDEREDERLRRQDEQARQAQEQEQRALQTIQGGGMPSTPEQYMAIGQNLMQMGETDRAQVYFGLAEKMRGSTEQGYTLTPGSVRFGPDGKPIASVPAQQARQSDPYFQAIPTPQGYMRFNARTGQMEPINVDGAVPVPIAADANLKRDMSYAGAEGAASGKFQGEAAVQAGATLAKADQAMKVIDDTLEAPGLSTATGASGVLDPRNYMWGTEAANARTRIDQLQGQAFLEAFESLKGGGQITEVEGKKATDAMARLSRAQSDEEFRKSLGELRSIISAGRERAATRVNAPPAMLQRPSDAGIKFLGFE